MKVRSFFEIGGFLMAILFAGPADMPGGEWTPSILIRVGLSLAVAFIALTKLDQKVRNFFGSPGNVRVTRIRG
jgi:hypothetical protein